MVIVAMFSTIFSSKRFLFHSVTMNLSHIMVWILSFLVDLQETG